MHLLHGYPSLRVKNGSARDDTHHSKLRIIRIGSENMKALLYYSILAGSSLGLRICTTASATR